MDEEINEELIALQAIVEKILFLMGIPGNISSKKEKGNIVATIKTKEGKILIGKEGKNLNALQEIIRAIFFKKTNIKRRVVLDVNGYRKKIEEGVIKIAHEAAEKAATTKKEISLPPMPAHLRYLVHSFLKDDHRVTTMSQGEGSNRCVVVIPNE